MFVNNMLNPHGFRAASLPGHPISLIDALANLTSP